MADSIDDTDMRKRVEADPLPGEDVFVQKLIDHFERQTEETYPSGKMLRGVQTKQHGCVRAEFVVEPDLPEALRVGVFKQARTYPAWIRFANQNRIVQPDIKRDVRGMSPAF